MKLLVTGFDPFGGQKINPAWEAVKRLPERIGEWDIVKQMVPTVYRQAFETARAAAETVRPDAVLCVGQAGGRDAVTPEMVAVNLRYARIPDNAGQVFYDEPVKPDGPAAYFATLPVRRMAERMQEKGVPARVSYSAGAFVCNDLFYLMSDLYSATSVRTAFIHVPFLPEQAGETQPSMTLEEIVRGLTEAITVLSEE